MTKKRGLTVNRLEQDKFLTFSRCAASSPVYTTTSVILRDGHDGASTLLHVATVFSNGLIGSNFTVKLPAGSQPEVYIPTRSCSSLQSSRDADPLWDTFKGAPR